MAKVQWVMSLNHLKYPYTVHSAHNSRQDIDNPQKWRQLWASLRLRPLEHQASLWPTSLSHGV